MNSGRRFPFRSPWHPGGRVPLRVFRVSWGMPVTAVLAAQSRARTDLAASKPPRERAGAQL